MNNIRIGHAPHLREIGLFIPVMMLMMMFLIIRKRKSNRWLTRQWVVRPMNANRTYFGESYTAYWEMRLDPQKFHERYRMRVETYDYLLDMLRPRLRKRHPSALPAHLRLNVCLRYLMHADCISTVALAERIGNSTARELIREVCSSIIDILGPIYLRQPTEDEWRQNAADFLQYWNMPNCVGAIDGKHVTIEAPPNSGTEYFNYQRYFSSSFLAVCDARYRFTMVHVGEQGSNSDAGIFSECLMGRMLINGELNMPRGTAQLPGSAERTPCYIVGDDAFPLKPCLMKPYPGQNLTQAQTIFNYCLSRARRVIENTFGILAARFRIFRSYISFDPDTADMIVYATLILHNFLKVHEDTMPPEERVYCPPRFTDWVDDNGAVRGGEWRNDPANWRNVRHADARNNTNYAIRMRNKLRDYFLTPEGEVPWQYNRVRNYLPEQR